MTPPFYIKLNIAVVTALTKHKIKKNVYAICLGFYNFFQSKALHQNGE